MNVLLVPIIESNGGFFRRAEALACGESDRSLQRALRSRQITRLRQGAYAMTADLALLDPEARHLLLARAVVANQRGRVALTGPPQPPSTATLSTDTTSRWCISSGSTAGRAAERPESTITWSAERSRATSWRRAGC